MSSSQTKLDLTKPVTTRDGRAVRILCTDRAWKDGNIEGPLIVALIQDDKVGEQLRNYTFDGRPIYGVNERDCLINLKNKFYLLVFLAKDETIPKAGVYNTEEKFKINKDACLKMGWPILKEEILEVDI